MTEDLIKNWKSCILLTLLFSTLSLLTVFKMVDTDVWFHMKAGQIIIETGRFIYKDIFSYTAEGREWLYHEWLFGVVSYHVYSWFGINGLILGKAVLLTLTFIVIYKCMRLRDVNPYLASFILFIAVLAARFRFTERPHLFKFLFVATFIYLLDLYRIKGKNRLWLLPVIQLIWVDIHGSFILGPAIISIYLFSWMVDRKRQGIEVLTIILILAILATFVNPYGSRLTLFSLGFGGREFLPSLTEWSPTGLKDFYGAFGLLFIAGIVSFAVNYRRVEVVDILLFSLFAYLSLKAIRFTALFSLATAPITARDFSYLSSGLAPRRLAKDILICLFSFTIIGLLSVHEIKRNPILLFGLGQRTASPDRAFEFLKRLPIEGNMYNSYVFGGYLIWKGYPEKKVFVDGRAEVYDKEFQDAFIGGASVSKWFEATNRYDINYAVISYSKEGIDPIGKWISKDQKWVLIYWDDAARVYVRDIPRNKDIIGRFGHRIMISPIDFNHALLKDAISVGMGDRLANELKTDIESNPLNITARYWLGMLCYETGRRDEAVNAWEELVKIRPDANTYSSMGNVFTEKGDYAKAIKYYKKAIKTDKSFVEAYYNIGNAYQAVGKNEEATKAYRRFIKYAGPKYADVVKGLREKGIE